MEFKKDCVRLPTKSGRGYEDTVLFDEFKPLVSAMRSIHVEPGEWHSAQYWLLECSPGDFTPEKVWMAEHFRSLHVSDEEFLAWTQSPAYQQATKAFSSEFQGFVTELRGS